MDSKQLKEIVPQAVNNIYPNQPELKPCVAFIQPYNAPVDDGFKQFASDVLNFYLDTDNYNEVVNIIFKFKIRLEEIMKVWLASSLHKTLKERAKLGNLLGRLIFDRIIDLQSAIYGFDRFVEMVDGNLWELDIPELWSYLSEVFQSFMLCCSSFAHIHETFPEFHSIFRKTLPKTQELLVTTNMMQGDVKSPVKSVVPEHQSVVKTVKSNVPDDQKSSVHIGVKCNVPEESQVGPEDLRSVTTSILNRLTPQTFDSLSEEFVALESQMTTGELAAVIIDCIFEKICQESRFCEMCCILCELMTQKQAYKIQSSIINKTKSFRYRLMTKCQQIFELSKNIEKVREEKLDEMSKLPEGETKLKMVNDLEKSVVEQKTTVLRSIRFIANLCQQKLVSKFIAHLCIQHLLTKSNDPETLSCLCGFLTVVGKNLEEDEESSKNPSNNKEVTETYFEQLNKIYASQKLPKRITNEIKKLLDLRKNKWVPITDPVEDSFHTRSAECYICFEAVDHQKFLSCAEQLVNHHYLCENCINKLSTNAPWSKIDKLISCPVCRSETLLPGGNVNKLKTKFFVDIMCEKCFKIDDIQERKWCDTCNVSLCSSCAKDHSDHSVSAWEDYLVPSLCMSILKADNKSQQITKINKFCEDLKNMLIATVDESRVASAELSTNIENAFGISSSSPKKSTAKTVNEVDVEKKLKVTLNVLKSHKSFKDMDTDKLISTVLQPKLPSVNEVKNFLLK